MKTASQILEKKGYGLDEINDIICANHNSLDEVTRDKFGVMEPIHLWEAYYLGDANEDSLLEVAKDHGFDDIKSLLKEMDMHLISLAEAYKEKIKMRIIETQIESNKPYVIVVGLDEADAEIFAQQNAAIEYPYFEGMTAQAAADVSEFFENELTESERAFNIKFN